MQAKASAVLRKLETCINFLNSTGGSFVKKLGDEVGAMPLATYLKNGAHAHPRTRTLARARSHAHHAEEGSRAPPPVGRARFARAPATLDAWLDACPPRFARWRSAAVAPQTC